MKITFEVDQSKLFDMLREVKGDTFSLGQRIVECMLAGTGWFMQAVAKEVAQMKSEMFDIQCYIEEQEGQGE